MKGEYTLFSLILIFSLKKLAAPSFPIAKRSVNPVIFFCKKKVQEVFAHSFHIAYKYTLFFYKHQ